MKIAVCISGVPRSGVGDKEQINRNYKRNFKNLQKNFSAADFYIGTWRQYENELKRDFPDQLYWVFDEPEAHYNPYLTMPLSDMISDKMRNFEKIYRNIPHLHERVKHQAKQIICHANMVNSLPEKYDVIIRARFDTFVYAHANFDQHTDDVYNNKTAIGFATLKPQFETFNIQYDLDKNDPIQSDGAVSIKNNLQKYLFDGLIMHHGDCIDTKYIFKLFCLYYKTDDFDKVYISSSSVIKSDKSSLAYSSSFSKTSIKSSLA